MLTLLVTMWAYAKSFIKTGSPVNFVAEWDFATAVDEAAPLVEAFAPPPRGSHRAVPIGWVYGWTEVSLSHRVGYGQKGYHPFLLQNMNRKRVCNSAFRSRTHRECIVKSTIWFSKCVRFAHYSLWLNVQSASWSFFGLLCPRSRFPLLESKKQEPERTFSVWHVQALDNLVKLVLS